MNETVEQFCARTGITRERYDEMKAATDKAHPPTYEERPYRLNRAQRRRQEAELMKRAKRQAKARAS